MTLDPQEKARLCAAVDREEKARQYARALQLKAYRSQMKIEIDESLTLRAYYSDRSWFTKEAEETKRRILFYWRELARSAVCRICNDRGSYHTEVAFKGGVFVSCIVPCSCTGLGAALRKKTVGAFIGRHGYDPRELDAEEIKLEREYPSQPSKIPQLLAERQEEQKKRQKKLAQETQFVIVRPITGAILMSKTDKWQFAVTLPVNGALFDDRAEAVAIASEFNLEYWEMSEGWVSVMTMREANEWYRERWGKSDGTRT
jgi:hypothetical protein